MLCCAISVTLVLHLGNFKLTINYSGENSNVTT